MRDMGSLVSVQVQVQQLSPLPAGSRLVTTSVQQVRDVLKRKATKPRATIYFGELWAAHILPMSVLDVRDGLGGP